MLLWKVCRQLYARLKSKIQYEKDEKMDDSGPIKCGTNNKLSGISLKIQIEITDNKNSKP